MLFIKSEVAGYLSSILPFIMICIALTIGFTLILSSTLRRFLFRSVSLHLSFLLIVVFCSGITQAQNAIVTENALPGNPSSDWAVNTSADFRNVNLNGYATDISVNKGSTVHFKVDAQNGVNFTIQIYRLGYYNGDGARLVADLGSPFPGIKQPDGISDPVTGLLDCSNWSESASWTVPAGAVSGIYIAKLESAAGRNHIVFIVRDDASHSKILFQANDATWQAYNAYGGSNLYNGITGLPNGHASKVSYNRPFFIYNASFGTNGLGSDWYMNDTYPMIRWLERNGYDMTYTTNTDVSRFGGLLLNHNIFATAGHDEYWSKEQRDNVEAARTAGVNLAFFTGNETYWKTRWEADVNSIANRVLVCYKEGTLADGTTGEGTCGSKCDVSAPTIWTGLWRMGAAYDAPLPENALTGQISWEQSDLAIEVPFAYKDLRFWRNTTVATLTTGQTRSMAPSSLGYESDFEQFPNTYPHGRITMSSTAVGANTHKLSLYKSPAGGWVFGAGTVLWSWGLDDQHFGTPNTISQDMQQATVNLFADMGVQPGTLQSELTAAAASTDVTPPASIITSPANGSTQPVSSLITISGTASDVGGAIGGVEVSVDGGTTWQVAVGTTNWSFSWDPVSDGVFTIKSRAYDDSGNMEDGTVSSGPNVVNITLTPAACPCHIFSTQTPADPLTTEVALELGVKFRSSEAGFITGIRFFKTTNNIGTHVGELYSSTGTRLASATFTSETASGWQTVNFSSPVAIAANTTYIAAYFSPSGTYTGTANYFTTAVNNDPLTGLADGTDGPNGVYKYTATPAFPTGSAGNKPNYWVDVTFTTTSTPTANAGPEQTLVLPTSTATLDGSGSTGTITNYTWTNISGPSTPVITTPNAVSTTVTGLVAGTYIFQLSINAGASTSQVTVNVLPAGSSVTIFTDQFPTDNLSTGNPVELGVKFRSSQDGYINGIRFYKTAGNNGAHVGELYSSTGTKLATATFNGESASGWQTVLFSAPVAVTKNTTYVAAYFSPGGTFTATQNYFTTAVVNSPLTGLADGTDGPNGVFLYNSTPAFPINGFNQTNYWVDALFSSTLNPVVANAGPDQTIVLPTSTATLDGSASSGTITDYTWTNVSGPNTPVITTPATVSTTVTGLVAGTYIFKLSVNGGISSSQVAVNVLPSESDVTIFTTQFPTNPLITELQPLELGVKFQSSQAGYVTGVRFYKTIGNDGAHIGELYSSTGTKLASANFSGETASGWQTVTFNSPVAITANTTYVAAYFSPNGTYTGTANYFTTAVVNTPLTGLADGTDGPNGVFKYTPGPAFPSSSAGNKPNYWVDVTFTTTLTTVVANAGPDQTIILPVSSLTLDGSGSTGPITDYTWSQISGPNAAAITTPGTVTTNVTGLIAGTYVFQLSVNGDLSTSQVTVKVLPAGSSITIFTIQTPPDDVTNNDGGQAIELGVKFRSSQAGFINGVRFYKTTGNTGTHIGELYDAAGNNLASATFTSETTSGWQTVEFASPVPIAANTTYVASYFSSDGNYKGTQNYFTSAVVHTPLTALADGTDGSNGVFLYTPTPGFPINSFNKTNYWVDAVFTESSTALPVQYLIFAATKQGNNAKLQWTTSQEVNNKGFEIQRSTDGSNWEVISFVTGAGNSQTSRDYQYIDENLAPGTYYYRLRQVDFDGKSDLSKVVRVTISGELAMELFQNRPNPFNNTTTIVIVIPKAGRISLTVYDQLGRPVRKLLDADKLPGTYSIIMNRDGLNGGIYYYKLDSKDESATRKMTIY